MGILKLYLANQSLHHTCGTFHVQICPISFMILQMYRGSFPTNGHNAPGISSVPSLMTSANTRVGRTDNSIRHCVSATARSTDITGSANSDDQLTRRPIIREEELNRMDDMTKDMGWAAQEEIDYK